MIRLIFLVIDYLFFLSLSFHSYPNAKTNVFLLLVVCHQFIVIEFTLVFFTILPHIIFAIFLTI